VDERLFNDSDLPPDLMERARSELRDGERLLWVGQPRPGRFAKQAIPLVIFGIPWTGFALFWTAGASGLFFDGPRNGGFGLFSVLFPLFGLPFIFIGLALLSSPYWALRKAKRTFYALTDKRAILSDANNFGGFEIRDYGPAELAKLRRVEYGNGEGDLIFEEVTTISTSTKRTTTRTQLHGFMAIPNVKAIEELIRRALL
jgi:hypothetical protein